MSDRLMVILIVVMLVSDVIMFPDFVRLVRKWIKK